MFSGLLDCMLNVYSPTFSFFLSFPQCASFISVALNHTLAKSLDGEKGFDGVAEKSNPPEDNTYLVS